MNKRIELVYTLPEIESISGQLLNHFEGKKIYCFTGNLGLGKTTLITSLCLFLGTTDHISSPTFSLVNEYDAKGYKIYHFDLYRLNTMEEALDIGLEEYIYSGHYCFIEWPEKIANILPTSSVVYCKLSYLSALERKLEAWLV